MDVQDQAMQGHYNRYAGLAQHAALQRAAGNARHFINGQTVIDIHHRFGVCLSPMRQDLALPFRNGSSLFLGNHQKVVMRLAEGL